MVAGYGQTEILHGVSIGVDEGEVVTIIGPNGCGKSTVIKTHSRLGAGTDGECQVPGKGNIV